MLTKTSNRNEFFFLILGLLMIAFLATHSANIDYDSPSYINFDSIRPPLYPLYIWLFHWFGSYQFSLIMWSHGLLLFLTFVYVRWWLRTYLNIPEVFIFFILLFVLLTIAFHFQLAYIQSEGIAFPLFILAFFACIECFFKFNLVKIIYLALLVSLLVLTRLQFYYFYGIFVLLCCWYLWQRVAIKSVLSATVILVISIGLTTLADHGYHYTKHGFFGLPSYGNNMILIQTLFLADNNAGEYFKDPTSRNYIQKMIALRNSQAITQAVLLKDSFRPSTYEQAYQAYSRNYFKLLDIIHDTIRSNNIDSHIKSADSIDVHSVKTINRGLITNELRINALFLGWKFVDCVGSVPQFLFFLIILFSTLFQVAKNKIRNLTLPSIFLMVIPIITFCNAMIIAIYNPDLPVYFCYSQFMLYCLAALLVKKVFYHNHYFAKDLTESGAQQASYGII